MKNVLRIILGFLTIGSIIAASGLVGRVVLTLTDYPVTNVGEEIRIGLLILIVAFMIGCVANLIGCMYISGCKW